jgi:hypothetical protein
MHQELLQTLIQTNLCWLEQARELVASISDGEYADSPAGLSPHKVGAHLRHVLDFYESYLTGLESGYVDYDARKRDLRTAVERAIALERISFIARRLENLGDRVLGASLFVRVEDASEMVSGDVWMPSSVVRELQTLSSHTIHHFALIAITLKAHGVPLKPSFGTAPSTLRYQESLAA